MPSLVPSLVPVACGRVPFISRKNITNRTGKIGGGAESVRGPPQKAWHARCTYEQYSFPQLLSNISKGKNL